MKGKRMRALAHHIPKTYPYEMCQMPNKFDICYNIVPIVERYGWIC